jgi:hypothetical protein
MPTAKSVTKPLPTHRPPRAVRVPVLVIVRILFLASFSILGCIWALWRYYTHPRSPMFVPTPAATTSPTEIPAPEREPAR